MLSSLSSTSILVRTSSVAPRQNGRYERQQFVVRAGSRRSNYHESSLAPSVGPEPGAKVQLVKRSTTVVVPPPPPPPPPKELLSTPVKAGLGVGAAILAFAVWRPWSRGG